MAKVADKYLKTDPWAVVEVGFDAVRNRVSESIFSLGNEYMGVRGYPDEGYGGDSLIGSYFNGLYEEMDVGAHYKGVIRRLRYMANAVNWLYTRIQAEGETLDLSKSRISGFTRRLDFRTGTYEREFVWHLASGKSIKISFLRLVSMTDSNLGCQRISFEPVDYDGTVAVRSGLDFSVIHEDQRKNLWETVRTGRRGGISAILGKTVRTGNRLFSGFSIQSADISNLQSFEEEKRIGVDFELRLQPGRTSGFVKIVTNVDGKDPEMGNDSLWEAGMSLAGSASHKPFDHIMSEQADYWVRIWDASDITIEGDPDNQQGIRFCMFQMYQTYRGEHSGFNIGAKGLTGEAYRGLAFWDTETYCLPFYLFNNPKAAKSLLEFRYRSLRHAVERATEVDCRGAFYPIATIDGTESCDLWQHSNLQLHVGSAVAYGIRHYVETVRDVDFLYDRGVEMLLQLCRFYESRGQWGQQTGEFGYFGVMGPDEFQLMVNNNCYLNLMAKKLFEYTLEAVDAMKREAPGKLESLMRRLEVTEAELSGWKVLAEKMRIPLDPETGIYEQHDGFFNMPHIDIHSIPVEQFPLYHHWSYDRLYRYDMIKQPDVLMFMFLYNRQFTLESKRANYEYYEPRCIHESSLSPSIHSILASEIGKHDEAYRFFEFATRLDLDNYNRNTREGLHTTSIAAAWMNIVYGFGGMRSDGGLLLLKPSIPKGWSGYSFKITYRGAVLRVEVDRRQVKVQALSGGPVDVEIFRRVRTVGLEGIVLELPADRAG